MGASRPMDSNNNNNKTFSLLLDWLPLEMREKIYEYCTPAALGMFARTSYQVKQETVFFRLQYAAVSAAPESYKQKDGTKLAAIAILKEHPELLFKRSLVTDHYQRKIEASPY
jgi:hypothetical protein